MEIPDEAAELILKYWQERGISNCVKAKFLTSNQTGNCFMTGDCFMRDNENDEDSKQILLSLLEQKQFSNVTIIK